MYSHGGKKEPGPWSISLFRTPILTLSNACPSPRTGYYDRADFYYAANAYNPSWILIGTVGATGSGLHTLTAQYTIPSNSAIQAVRVNFRYTGSVSPCSAGQWDDVDDLAILVDTTESAAEGHMMKPNPTVEPKAFNSSGCASLDDRKRCYAASDICEWQKGRDKGWQKGRDKGCNPKAKGLFD